MSESEQTLVRGQSAFGATGAAVATWLVPGLGHVLLGRWRRGWVYFLSVGALAVVGILMRGNIFSPGGQDIFDRLGFFAELGSGVFYFLAHNLNPAGGDISRAAKGITARACLRRRGVLNLLCVLEAFHLGFGGQSAGERHSTV